MCTKQSALRLFANLRHELSKRSHASVVKKLIGKALLPVESPKLEARVTVGALQESISVQ